MDIVPWKSFGEISRLRREMDDLLPEYSERHRFQIKIKVK
jgi:hypothetical protein